MGKLGANTIVFATLLIASTFALFPLPDWLLWSRPHWLALVVIFWVQAMPDRMGVWLGFGVGLWLDLLLGSAFGLHAFPLSLLAWLVFRSGRRFRVQPVQQQVLVILLLLLGYQLLLYLLISFTGHSNGFYWSFWLPAFISALVWPVVMGILQGLQARWQIR